MVEGDCYECGLNETCDYGDGICVTFDSFEITVDMEQDPVFVGVVPVVAHDFIPMHPSYEDVEARFA
jgi:hypothetical protein